MRILAPALKPACFFLMPACVVLGLFFFMPILAALLLSLTDFDIYALGNLRNTRWVGWDNYRHLLGDPLFRRSLVNTLYFVGVGGPL
ncbi:MAG: sugar ABC transporter permease, partial [Planctomycetes bacterium]|nr:sugar ABC transporter permease [Planctomycetota bacterium]